jgi:hypothetical protein
MPMTDPGAAAVTYVGLPISSGGAHSLGRMSHRVAHERTLAFLQTCAKPVTPARYSFRVHDVPQLREEARFNAELWRRFGHYADIPEDRVTDALDYLDEIDPQPANQWGMAPVWFTASFDLRILDPLTGEPLPGQDSARFHAVDYEWGVPLGTSRLRLILSNTARVALELCIPTAEHAVLRRVVPWLQQHAPFKFSPKQWRVWTPTRSGSFKARKLIMPDLVGEVSR